MLFVHEVVGHGLRQRGQPGTRRVLLCEPRELQQLSDRDDGRAAVLGRVPLVFLQHVDLQPGLGEHLIE